MNWSASPTTTNLPPSLPEDRNAQAGLAFADPAAPGITRKRNGKGWHYFTADGTRITANDEIARLNAIALPPAYEDAWFAPHPNAHILAWGFDQRGRRQYRYHPDFRSERDSRKFDLCCRFGQLLPVLRKQVRKDMSSRKLTRERAIASVVALLDTGQIRVGNECYVRDNKTFGATTLRMRHVRLEGGAMVLRFRAKNGAMREVRCDDRQLIRFVRRMQDLRGQHLFQYLDDAGAPVPIGSADVNDYLHEVMGEEFTARNFRTWAASVLAFEVLWKDRDTPLALVLETVSRHLGNTRTIARKSYVHPAIIEAAKGRKLLETLMPVSLPRSTQWLTSFERGFLKFLENAERPARKSGTRQRKPR
jgi:DNA topoisomerase I